MDNKFYEELKTCLNVYWQATGVSLLLLDRNGKEQKRFGNPNAYCDLIHQNEAQLGRCMKVHADLGHTAERNGECYFYQCHANMMHFAIALIERGEYAGSIVAGPVMAEYPSASTLDEVIRECEVPSGCRSLFLSAMQNIQVVDPERMYYLGELLYHLILHLLSGDDFKTMQLHREQSRQQELIGDVIHGLKAESRNNPDHVRYNETMRSMQEHQERELSEMLADGRLEEAQDILNDILGNIYFTAGGIDLIKLRINELITVLTRRMIENGANTGRIYDLVGKFQKKTAETTEVEEISFALSQLLPRLISMLQEKLGAGAGATVKKALEYIHRHYRETVTLEQTAVYASVSPSHFSRIFHEEMGVGFSAYVNRLRVEKAKKLLNETNLTLAEIAQAVGFSNQQYFSKVFKAETGKTPGQYRK